MKSCNFDQRLPDCGWGSVVTVNTDDVSSGLKRCGCNCNAQKTYTTRD